MEDFAIDFEADKADSIIVYQPDLRKNCQAIYTNETGNFLKLPNSLFIHFLFDLYY